MNVEKIFNALKEDTQNSGLGIVCCELENQGYEVGINSTPVTSEGFFEGEYTKLEALTEPYVISISKKGIVEQNFAIEFVDFHTIIIKSSC